jgi:hypothetical protein
MKKPPGPEAVRTLATAYNACVIDGFKAAGWITDTDLARVRIPLAAVPETMLLGELQRRARMRASEEQGWTVEQRTLA